MHVNRDTLRRNLIQNVHFREALINGSTEDFRCLNVVRQARQKQPNVSILQKAKDLAQQRLRCFFGYIVPTIKAFSHNR